MVFRMLTAYFRFQGKRQYVEKGHLTLVIQVDLMLQDWREFKIFVTIALNSLSSCEHLLWLLCSFYSW